jgi:2-haloacid dehalogenase
VSKREVVFMDADETLFDFRKAEAFALERSFAQFGLELSEGSFRDYDEINKGLWLKLERGETTQASLKTERFRLLFERLHADLDPALFGAAYIAWLSRASFLLEGAEEICAYLGSRYRLAIITNGIQEVQAPRIDASSIRGCLSGVVISEAVGCSKPSPRIFERAAELLDFHDKAGMIMVGDSLSSDIQGGINYGIDTCWANLGAVKNETSIVPSFEIRSLGELRFIL